MEKNGKRPTNASPFITLSPHLIVYVHRTATGAPMMWYIVCIYTHKYPGVMYVRDLLAGFVIGISDRFCGTGGVRPTNCVSCIEMERSCNPEPKISNFSWEYASHRTHSASLRITIVCAIHSIQCASPVRPGANVPNSSTTRR